MGGQSESKTKRRRIPLWGKIVLAVLLALAALIAFPHVYFGLKVRAELNRIKAEGAPMTLAECDALYPTPPPGQNAADVLVPAIAMLVQPADPATVMPNGVVRFPPRGNLMPGAMVTAVDQWVRANSSALKDLRIGASMPHCRYAVTVSWQSSTSPSNFRRLGTLREAQSLLNIEALLRAQRHDLAGAVDSLKAAIGLAHSLADEPLGISQMYHDLLDAAAMNAMERILSLEPLSSAQLEELSEMFKLDEAGRDDAERRVLMVDRCMGSLLYEAARRFRLQLGRPGIASVLEDDGAVVIGLMTADHLTYLKRKRREIDAFKRPFPERLAALNEINKSTGGIPRWLLYSAWDPALQMTTQFEAKAIARLRAARTGLAIERFRIAKGMLPATLKDIAPGFMELVPTDPFDGKPLRYKGLAKGYVVYSIGPDGVDDKGTEFTGTANPYDVTFIVER